MAEEGVSFFGPAEGACWPLRLPSCTEEVLSVNSGIPSVWIL